MTSVPQLALIGHGAWGRNHSRVLRELGALRWVYDANPAALVGAPERTAFIEKIWDDPLTQGVVIATPPATHGEIAAQAIEAGKAVLIEKPMAMTTLSAQLIGSLAQTKGVPLLVGHLMAYHEGFRRLQYEALGVMGQVEYVYSHRLQPGRVRTDSSSLWQLAPHDVSMLIAVAGMPLSVACTGGVERTQGLADIVTATMEFNGGVRGHMFVSWLHPVKQREFMVMCSKGAVTMEQESPAIEPLRTELLDFLHCIATGDQPLVGAVEGINVVRVLEACDESMKHNGERVTL